MCSQAHIFDHDCVEAPKPWLSPPVGPNVKPPDELGEEGFMGAIPWPVVKYAVLIGLTWLCIFGWRRFDDFRCGCGCCASPRLLWCSQPSMGAMRLALVCGLGPLHKVSMDECPRAVVEQNSIQQQ
jgi:hypothetical protein